MAPPKKRKRGGVSQSSSRSPSEARSETTDVGSVSSRTSSRMSRRDSLARTVPNTRSRKDTKMGPPIVEARENFSQSTVGDPDETVIVKGNIGGHTDGLEILTEKSPSPLVSDQTTNITESTTRSVAETIEIANLNMSSNTRANTITPVGKMVYTTASARLESQDTESMSKPLVSHLVLDTHEIVWG
jgi:hypothetical protein